MAWKKFSSTTGSFLISWRSWIRSGEAGTGNGAGAGASTRACGDQAHHLLFLAGHVEQRYRGIFIGFRGIRV